MSDTTARLSELLDNFVESAIFGGFTDEQIIKSLHVDQINAAIKLAQDRRNYVIDKMRERFLNQPSGVPKSEWPAILERVKSLTPVGGGDGTHCYDHQYEFDGKRYSVVFEYGNEKPIAITVEEIKKP